VLHGFTPGASSYLWNTGATTADLPVTASGTYILTATNEIGISTDTVVVQIFSLPTVEAGPDVSVCTGAPVEFEGLSSGMCQWTDAAGNVVSDVCSFAATASESTTYVLMAISLEGCQASDTLAVQVLPDPAQPVIEANGNLLSVASGADLQWQLDGVPIPGATGPTYTPTTTGNYTVLATNAGGCSAVSEPYFFMVSGTSAAASDVRWSIFPNPATENKMFVQVWGSFQPESYVLFDVQGRRINSGYFTLETSGLYALPAPLQKGVYFLNIRDANGVSALKKVEVW
jgi:hypothetical protein